MGRIHIDLFTSLDGVAQAPGGPQEDPSGGFTFGGWQAPLIDAVVGEQVLAGMDRLDALLLGRRTYDIFAAYWPHERGAIADLFNRVPKYVATRHERTLAWEGSVPLAPDLPTAVRALRGRHDEVHVIGSLDLVQTLFAERFLDQLTLWVHPVVLGEGKRVFARGVPPMPLELVEPAVTSPSGVVQQRYRPLEGQPRVGDMTTADA